MTLSTSDTDLRTNIHAARAYVAVSVAVALFGAIYEHFSFGVYSYWMMYAFAVPLVLGALPALMLVTGKRTFPVPLIARKMWHAGVAALTVGSVFTGVLVIYGTSSAWSVVYGAAGCILLTIAAVYTVFTSFEAK